MKLFFDARFIRTDFHDGISRYSTELGNALAKLTDVTFIICDTKQLGLLPDNCDYVRIHAPTSPKEPFTSIVLNKFNPDVVYSPMQVMGSIGRKFKLILTSHDMIYYQFPQAPLGQPLLLRVGWRAYHATTIPERISLNGADIVATISHTVQREFEQAKLTKRPIIVVPNAPQDLSPYIEERTEGKPRNLLYMGSFMPYKNVETLIKGMQHLPNHTLHILSKGPKKRRTELQAQVPKNAEVVFHNGISDKEYAELLVNKAALVTASLAEGFGLPIVEAMAVGVPVVVSDIPIFHEVAGNSALYFEPKDAKEFAEKVKQLDSTAERAKLIEHGIKQAQTFTWKDSAQTLLTAAHSLVSSVTISHHG